jgi:hypothetical protein
MDGSWCYGACPEPFFADGGNSHSLAARLALIPTLDLNAGGEDGEEIQQGE